MLRATEVLETCLYAPDLEAAATFYRDVLGLTPYSEQVGRHVFFRCGQAMFLLFNPATTMQPGQALPNHGAVGPGHVAFASTLDDVPRWRQQLEQHGVTIDREITWPGGGRSLYLRDPAGNIVEIATPTIWP